MKGARHSHNPASNTWIISLRSSTKVSGREILPFKSSLLRADNKLEFNREEFYLIVLWDLKADHFWLLVGVFLSRQKVSQVTHLAFIIRREEKLSSLWEVSIYIFLGSHHSTNSMSADIKVLFVIFLHLFQISLPVDIFHWFRLFNTQIGSFVFYCRLFLTCQMNTRKRRPPIT
jgi:hypothetical protein